MGEWKFEPADFSVAWCEPETSNREMDIELATACAKVANAKLAKWLRDAKPMEALWSGAQEEFALVWAYEGELHPRSCVTHTAKLIEVKPVEKEG